MCLSRQSRNGCGSGCLSNRWPFTISKTFLPFDMTQIDQFANLHQVFTHDLYVMNYVLSEVFSDNEAPNA